MADTVRPDPFSSVYVLDAHFQYQDGVVDVFNSPAGRAVISNCSPTRMRHPVFPKPAKDVTKLLLDHHNNNHKMKYEEKVLVYEEDESRQTRTRKTQHWEQSTERLTDDPTDDGRNNNGRLTRRIVTFKNANNEVGEKTATVDIGDDDARINEKILRLKNHYERGFVADEKCDILKRMLTGFLSGWLFAKSSSGKWRKRKSSDDLYREASMALGIPCEMTDSCRCLDCQCNYFDCGDSDSDTSEVSINLNECDVEEWPCNEEEEELPVEKSFDVFYYEDEVKKKASPSASPMADEAKPLVEEERLDQQPENSTPGASSTGPAAICQDGGDPLAPSLEMAAGTPVLLDHILNTPLSCALQ